MKFLTDKEISNKIIIAILIVMIFNFISPTISQAGDIGGALFTPVAQLLATVSDLVVMALQNFFMGTANISTEELPGIDGSYKYYIRYSPGIIFSGNVAGLKVNFINAKGSDKVATEIVKNTKYIEEGSYEDLTDAPDFNEETAYTFYTSSDHEFWKAFEEGKAHIVTTWTNESKEDKYVAILTKLDKGFGDKFYDGLLALGAIALGVMSGPLGFIGGATAFGAKKYFNEAAENGGEYKVYRIAEETKTVYKDSSAFLLKNTVATWYKTLRAIALVGLLSVLVYIGIRILISTTGQEKAKYKKMITDWVAAICILFLLQYIMLFIIVISQKITDVLSASVIGEHGEDILMSNLRDSLQNTENTTFSSVFSQLILYLTMVIFTVIFTIQYLKRLLYMAFFTMIAPLIALTYPLDKIKDGQAQAFTIWLREYTFNALLQPMHLLLYYMFVSSALNLVNENPLYAIVAIGFLVPAEKFFRKMFGFDKASSAGQFGAAASGALIMNAVNKMGQRSGKAAAGKGGGSDSSDGSGSKTPRYISAPGSQGGGPRGGLGNGSTGNSGGGPRGGLGNGSTGGSGSGLGGSLYGQTINAANYGTGRRLNGVRTLAGQYNPANRQNRVRIVKAAGRGLRKGAIGAVGAATLGTVGLAAGVATGDPGNALKYGAAGLGAGYIGANRLGNKATEIEKKNRELYKQGKYGTDEYNRRNAIKELTRDNEFNSVCKEAGITKQSDREALIRRFQSNGITSSEDIKKSMNVKAKTGKSEDKIIAVQKIRKEAERYGMKRKDIKQDLASKGVSANDIKEVMDLMDML